MRENDLETIKKIPVLDIASRLGIQVKRRKANCFAGHDKKTPSLSFEPKRNIWKCFGCGKGGSGINLVMEVLNCDFKEALGWFTNEYGVPIKNKPLKSRKPRKQFIDREQNKYQEDTHEYKADFELYSWFLENCGPVSEDQGKIYLKSHGIQLDVADRFSVRELRYPKKAFNSSINKWGYERVRQSGLTWVAKNKSENLIWPSYTILFPFKEDNNVIYIQGRLFKGRRKFVNPTGIQKPLFNIDRLKQLPSGSTIHICEGVPDAIALEGAGFPSVAVMGATSFRKDWVDLFLHLKTVIIPDGDSGGDTFLRIVTDIFRLKGKSVISLTVPKGEDAASIISKIK